MNYVYDDGGRETAGFKGKNGDALRALSPSQPGSRTERSTMRYGPLIVNTQALAMVGSQRNSSNVEIHRAVASSKKFLDLILNHSVGHSLQQCILVQDVRCICVPMSFHRGA
jgi:hypothetical protein